jgi:hypothetical protein
MTLRLVQRSFNNENLLYESLIAESINMHGEDFKYVPRTFIAKDEILGEDRMSKFQNAYPIIMYIENTDGFDGQSMMTKFGLMLDKTANLIVARRVWDQMVGQYGQTVLPTRPAEGDLVYYPRSNTLLEINYVEHQQPFYQLGDYYTYKLTVTPFRYSSETIQTGDEQIDSFDGLKTTGSDPTINPVGDPVSYGDNERFRNAASTFTFDTDNPFGDL